MEGWWNLCEIETAWLWGNLDEIETAWLRIAYHVGQLRNS